MLDKIFFISGIALNTYIFYTIYNFNKLKEEPIKTNCLLKEGEEGEQHNLHSSQSVGHIQEKADTEDVIKERLRNINNNPSYYGFKNWLKYLPGIAGKI